MFTSEPSLAQRIERMIGDTPIVDPRSQIHRDQPGAPDLAALIGDRSIRPGLIAVGMTPDALDPTLPPDERVRRSIPYLKRMRNTAMAWCLFRIFRDLYDFDEPNLTEGNYRDLFDKVAKTGSDPEWARSVLHDRAKIRTVVTKRRRRDAVESNDPAPDYSRLELDYYISPGEWSEPEPPWESLRTKDEYLQVLEASLGERPTTTARLERLVFDWLDRTVTGKVRFTSAFLPIDRRFFRPNASGAQAVLDRAADGSTFLHAEANSLANFVTWSILKWHHERRKTLAIAVGAEHFPVERVGLPRSQEDWMSEMVPAFGEFSGAKFAIMTASDAMARDVAELAGQLPNVYAAGDWSPALAPLSIEKNFGLRVQVAPMTKIGGFLSDASSAEWSYGKAQVARKAMAAALARLIDSRFFEEDEIPPLLRQVLHDTPRDLYDLGDE